MTGSYRRPMGFRRHAYVATALMLAMPPAYAASDNGVTGRWFAEGFERSEHLQVFFDIQTGGTYEKQIRVIDSNCAVDGQAKEAGKWIFQRGNLATVSEVVDGKPVTGSPADTHDLFRVERVDDEHINLYDTETKLTWGLMLVTPDYGFPVARGCGL
jgi:hypothetical protein